MKWSQRFGLSVSSVRNVVRKLTARVTVLVKERQISEKHRMARDKPQTKGLQQHLADDCTSFHSQVHIAREQLVEGWCTKSLSWVLTTRRGTCAMLKQIWTSQKQIGKNILGRDETKVELLGHNQRCYAWWEKAQSIPGEELGAYCKIWCRVHHVMGLCG